jgi:hypothetical protein
MTFFITEDLAPLDWDARSLRDAHYICASLDSTKC